MSFGKQVADYKRNMLRELLDQCTEKQIDFFNRMYGSVDLIPEDKMKRAYEQCKDTLIKNKKRA